MKYKILYVKGTPASGKTILLNLLHQELLVRHPSLRVVSIPGWPEGMEDYMSQKYLEELLGVSLEDPASIPDTVLLLDEVQSTKGDRYFWNSFLKLIVQDGRAPLRVGMFGIYGSTGECPVEMPLVTPPILHRGQRVELQWHGTEVDREVGLYFSWDEANELFDKETTTHPERPQYSKDFRTYVFNITCGHAGAMTGILRQFTQDPVCCITLTTNLKYQLIIAPQDIRKNFILKGRPITTNACQLAVFSDITGGKFLTMILRCPFRRGLPHPRFFRDVHYASALRELLLAPNDYLPSEPPNDMLEKCYRMGWIQESVVVAGAHDRDIRGYAFPSPLHRWYVLAFILLHVHFANLNLCQGTQQHT